MKTRIRIAITLAAAVFCAWPNLAMAQAGPGDSQGGQAAAIEGTWIATVHIAPGVSFTALTSFTAGGVILATGTSDRQPPFAPAPTAPISPLYGSWTRAANKTYVASLNFFTFDINGNAVHMIQNNATYTVSDDGYSFTAIATGLTLDPNGGPCTVSCAPPTHYTITGTRLIAQGAA
jgi:hypothetical protein